MGATFDKMAAQDVHCTFNACVSCAYVAAFLCQNSVSISISARCDGINDCCDMGFDGACLGAGSDEMGCGE